MKKVLSILLCIGLFFSLTACGSSDGGKSDVLGDSSLSSGSTSNNEDTAKEEKTGLANPKGMFPITDEKVTLEVFAAVDPEANVNDNAYIKWFEEQTNVELKVTHRVTTLDDVTSQKTLLLASGDYPEVFFEAFTAAEQIQYGMTDGIIISNNDLYDQYADNFQKLYDEFPEHKQISYAPDGNVYGYSIPELAGHVRAYPKMWLNTAWLDELNMDVPTTTEEFKQMLIAFRDSDPGGAGAGNVIPLTGDIDDPVEAFLANSFLPFNVNLRWLPGSHFSYLDDDGVIQYAANQPAYKEALLYINDLWKEGLIDIAAYSQTSEQAKQTVMQKPTRVGAFVGMHLAQFIELSDEEMYSSYRAIEPLKGPEGVQWQPSFSGLEGQPTPGTYYAITDRCENPDVAFRVVDFMLSEESTIHKMGAEGIDWEYAPEGTKNIRGGECEYTLINYPPESEVRKTKIDRVFVTHPRLGTLDFRDKYAPAYPDEVLLTDSSHFESRLEWETLPLVEHIYPYTLPNMFFMTAEETTEFTQLYTNLNTHVIQSSAEFITGARDIEKEWDTYLKALDGFGLERFLELYQTAYDDFSAKS